LPVFVGVPLINPELASIETPETEQLKLYSSVSLIEYLALNELFCHYLKR